MLQLKQITKEYEIGKKRDKNYQLVKALKGVDLCFRQNEFVSILGPSGCGKTTMLNIIGGLDKYTTGDLIIKGKSTKEFKDKDWDNYRNHSVGFVFQSYNLISHQTILHNVELALTLSGVSRKERKVRALEALDKVGLKDRANVKPNQLSGGQMQRVAIARAIVNDPDIILADEPTGALDSKTSVQIMDILKELSKTRLVIMVTHNPELAESYSSRIVRFKDGELIDDTNPYTHQEIDEQTTNQKKVDEINPTSSDKHLTSQDNVNEVTKKPKKKMSFWTALSLSFKNLLTKKARTILVSFAGSIGIIGIALILAVSSGFSGYIDKIQEDTLSSYPIVIEEQSINYMSFLSSVMTSSENDGHPKDGVYTDNYWFSQLDSIANAYQNNDMKSFNTYLQENYTQIESYVKAIKYSYNLDLHIYQNDDDQFENPISPKSNVTYDMTLSYGVKYLAGLGEIKVTSLGDNNFQLEPQSSNHKEEVFLRLIQNTEGINVNTIRTAFAESGSYTLTEGELVKILNNIFKVDVELNYKNQNLNLFNEMIDNTEFVHSQYDLIAGNWNNDDLYTVEGRTCADMMLVLDKNNELDEYLLYALGLIDENQVQQLLDGILQDRKEHIKVDYSDIVGKEFKLYLKTDSYDNSGTLTTDGKPSADKLGNYITLRISGIVRPFDSATGGALDSGLVYSKTLTDECITRFNSAVDGGINLSPIDKSNPAKIAIYATSFKTKKNIEQFISNYNAGVDEEKKITYTDYVGLMMDGVSSIIDIISYVLIAFVSVSLVVSSIMIGIITYISVLERTKEIGVLRSVGASKKDIKRVFTAESLIIGFTAGALGIIITLLLCIPINIIMKMFTGISTLASLPVAGGIILILISMLLTFIAGLIPAKIASKKDPVVALRTE